MSKLREDVAITEGKLASPPEGDMRPYVIFTQLNPKAPYVYAGWVDAADEVMAVQFAREHYGQDQECVGLWAIPREAIAGTEPEHPASADEGPVAPYEVFTRKRAGDPYVAAGSVEAISPASALEEASRHHPGFDGLWVVPRDRIIATRPGDVIWRYTDQTYRLARGYAAAVRDKWAKIRAERDIREYEKDDLKEAF